ncbi:MAG TPA: hypothetical protein VK419_02995 [Bryobacteraceae bacterium]|nr:hypothetical protein [Bryobacteraceae bacterium]
MKYCAAFLMLIVAGPAGLAGAHEAATDPPTVTAVVNGVSYGTALCPGLLAVVYGANFGTDGTQATVTVGGKTAYVFTNSFAATQFAVQIPFELSPGPTTMTVTIGGVPSAAFAITLGATSPAFLSQNGSTFADVTNSTGSSAITLAAPAHPGDTVITYAVGLGVTNPPTPTGVVASGVTNQVSPLPTIMVGNAAASVIFAGVTSALPPGVYQVNLKLPANIQGTQPFVISIGGQSSPSTEQLPVAGLTSVVNNATFGMPGTIAPGSIASIFANGLGSANANEVSGLFPSTQSEGVQVTFNGEPAPMFHLIPAPGAATSPQQIDLYVPSDLPTSGTVNVQLTTSSSLYPNYTLNMVPASPGLYRFTDPKTSTQFVIAQFANTAWLVLPVSTTANLGLPACTSTTSVLTECGQPATIGDILTIYLTGLGLATPNGNPAGKALPTGTNPPIDGSVLYETPTLPTVTIGGIPATVLFSGLVPGYAGEYQIDVQVPSGVTNGDNVPVVVTMLGASDTTNISIQPGRIPPP